MSDAILSRAEGGQLVPVYVVVGDARTLVDRAVDRITRGALARCGIPAFNHAVYRASEAGVDQALSTARTLPMMADLRLVVVLDIQEGNNEFFQNLTHYLKEPSPTTVLVLAGTGFPPVRKGGSNWGARVQNATKKIGAVVKYDARKLSAPRFAQAHAASLGKELSPRLAEVLVEVVGQDLDRLVHEIDKLALYVGDAEAIGADDIHAASSHLAEAVVWDLTASIAARDPDRALAALHRLLEGSGRDGDDQPHKLLGLITWQLREVLKVAELVGSGAPDSEIRRAVRMRPAQLRRIRRAVGEGARGPEMVLGQLAAANRAMNLSRAGDRRVLEVLVVELCST